MLQKHPRTVELGGLLLRRFDAWKITFLSGRSIFRGQASGISIPSYLAHTPSTSHTNFMLQNPQKARNGATTVKIWMIYSKVFWNKTTSAGWSPNLPEPCHKFWWELDIRPFKFFFFVQSNFCPMIKAKSCGTSSEGYRRNREHFPRCFNMEGRRWTLGKDPHTIHETNGIFTYMNGWFFMVNVGEYSIDGCYGINIWKRQLSHWEFGRYM